MKLLLTSAGFQNPAIGKKFLSLLDKPVENVKILFIPTASRISEELFYVEKSKEELVKLGINISNITIFDINKVPSVNETLENDVMYVCGGNTYYLSYKMKETGYETSLKKFVKSGKLYVGVSAGSILAGPDIGISRDDNDIGLTDFSGLKFTKIVPIVHYTKGDKRLELSNKKFQSVALTDDQALLIIDGDQTLIE